MADSVGAGGFPNNINIGHVHLDMSTGLSLQYLGGRPGQVINWKPIGGTVTSDPSTIGWGEQHSGSMWFNKSERVFKYWNGTQLVSLS